MITSSVRSGTPTGSENAVIPALEIQARWKLYRDKRDDGLREQLIIQYAPLVKYVIGRMAVSLPGLINHEDVLSLGTIGLIQAVDRYDPDLGVKFETYAIRRIRGNILDANRRLHPLSRDANRRAREIERAYDCLIQKLERMPDDREVAEHLGLTVAEFHMKLLDASATIVSLDAPLGESLEGERVALIDQIADEDEVADVARQVERQEMRGALIQAVGRLTERDRLVISLYYCEELTLREISDVLRVSTSRVSQLHATAIFKLRGMLRATRAPANRDELVNSRPN